MRQSSSDRRERRTLGHEGVHGREGRVFRVVRVRAVDEVLQEQQVPRAALHDREEPVAELELAAPVVRLLSRHKVRELGVLGEEQAIGVERVGKGGDKGGVEREVGEVREQDGREGRDVGVGERGGGGVEQGGERGVEGAVEVPDVDEVGEDGGDFCAVEQLIRGIERGENGGKKVL